MRFKSRTIAFIGMFAALSFVLSIFPHFPILPAFEFLKIDFAEVPTLYAAAALSPAAGIIILLIKNLLHFLLMADEFSPWGELSNFLIGSISVGSFGFLISKIKRNDFRKISLHAFLALPFQMIGAIFVNMFIMIPLIQRLFFPDLAYDFYLLYGVIPFNLIKFLLNTLVFLLVYRFTYKPFSKIVRK